MSAAAQPFGYPDTIKSPAAQLSSKTRKLPDGRFEAVAAIFFMGRRGLTLYAIAASRYRALREAEQATETRSKMLRALGDGRVSYTAFGCEAPTGKCCCGATVGACNCRVHAATESAPTACAECDRKVVDGAVRCPLGRECWVGRQPAASL